MTNMAAITDPKGNLMVKEMFYQFIKGFLGKMLVWITGLFTMHFYSSIFHIDAESPAPSGCPQETGLQKGWGLGKHCPKAGVSGPIMVGLGVKTSQITRETKNNCPNQSYLTINKPE